MAVPRKLILKQLSKHYVNDIENCCLISNTNYKLYQYFYGEKNIARITNQQNSRVIVVYPTSFLNDSKIYVTEQFFSNFNEPKTIVTLKDVNINQFPKIATKVLVSFVNNNLDVSNALLERLLFNYFKTPKLLYKNDIFEISIKETCSDILFTKVEASKYFFKCVNILGTNNVTLKKCFCINGETELSLTHNIQSYIPKSFNLVTNPNELEVLNDFLLDRCPFGYKDYETILLDCIKPFLSKNKPLKGLLPLFLIRSPTGEQKSMLVEAIANKLGLHLLKFECNDLSSFTAVHTETKLRNIFLKSKLCSPCIVLLNNFQILCLDSDGHDDPRLMSFFQNECEILLTNNNYPIILVCNSNDTELNSYLLRMFLQIINIELPTQDQRLELIRWLFKLKNIPHKSIDLENISRRTHSFSFGDLEHLINKVLENGYYSNEINQDMFLNVMDQMQNDYSDSIGAPKIPKVYWEDIGGLNEIKQEIIKTIEYPLKYQHLLKDTILKRSGLLLYGPPGTGKTLIAKAVATECGLHFLSIKGPELLNMYVGQSESNVREVFQRARDAAPCILFFDELDSLAPNRGISGDSGGVMDRVVSQLLAEMDGINDNTSIFIIGATNRPDLIDPALLRPGRFDKLLYVGISTDSTSKLMILKALTRKFNFSEDLLKDVVKILPENITGADLQALCSNAWLISVRKKITELQIEGKSKMGKQSMELTFDDFVASVKLLKPSVNKETANYY
ncbi:peroxisome assembly factor 2, partial [Chrysoperla carnea]|uniref:peroxisome assembly factor 2 n=1 Tax=Chrysoperla carnea TaxID=189513 RepID=UPI001D08BEAF